MTRNLLKEVGYDHEAVMRLCNAVMKNSGTHFDAVYLLSFYLQQAMDKGAFNSITKVCEMSDEQFNDFYNANADKGYPNGF
jgi:hypothetical protein